MTNIAFLHGNGYVADDVLYKLPIIKSLGGHDIFIASRINSEVHIGPEMKDLLGDRLFEDIRRSTEDLKARVKKYEFIYDSPYLNRQYSAEEIMEIEQWLGISLNYIATFDKDFYDRDRRRDRRDAAGLMQFGTGMALFFRDFFINNDIRAFFTNMEDDIFSIVALYTARRLGIKLIGYTYAKFPRKGVWLRDNIRDVFTWNDKLPDWEEINHQYQENTIAGKWVMERNAGYFSMASIRQRFKGLHFNRAYKRYIKMVIKQYPPEKYIIECTDLGREVRKYLTSFIRRKRVRSVIVEPDFNDKYYLFALHYMQDAQISYREPMLDQFELIKNIARAMPAGHYLYVKPHPHFFGSDVSFKDLKSLKLYSNIKIINPSAPPQKLIRNAKCVVTVNSATGFEAIIVGVPVITIGHDFYCRDDLCHVVRDINDLPAALMAPSKVSRKTAEDFVRAAYASTIWIKGIQYDYGYYGLSDEEGKNIGVAIDAIIGQNVKGS